jgi:hypothetical protein
MTLAGYDDWKLASPEDCRPGDDDWAEAQRERLHGFDRLDRELDKDDAEVSVPSDLRSSATFYMEKDVRTLDELEEALLRLLRAVRTAQG